MKFLMDTQNAKIEYKIKPKIWITSQVSCEC